MVNASEFSALSVEQKIQLVTELWGQIASCPDLLQLPSSVDDEADRRFERLERDPNSGLSEDQMWRQVDEARRKI